MTSLVAYDVTPCPLRRQPGEWMSNSALAESVAAREVFPLLPGLLNGENDE